MKTNTTGLFAHLASGNTTVSLAWRITRKDSVIEGYTDNVTDLVVDGTTCEALTSTFRGSNIETRAEASVANMDVEVLLSAAGIDRDDLLSGIYDFAAFEVFLVNYHDATQFDIVRAGWLGEVSVSAAMATVEARGLAQALQQRIGEVTSATCRADFGDVRCGVSLATWTATGTLTSVTDKTQFRDSAATSPPGSYQYGLLTFSTGAANAGQQMEVKEFSASGAFVISAPVRQMPATGDAYSCYAGCNKLATTCKTTFSNIANMRAEVFLIGQDELLRFGRQ